MTFKFFFFIFYKFIKLANKWKGPYGKLKENNQT
jgi:hypothetical protein